MIVICCSKNIYSNFIHNSINEYLSWLDVEYDPDFLNDENINLEYSIRKFGQTPNVIVILEISQNSNLLRNVYKNSKIVTYTNDIHYFDFPSKNLKYLTYSNSDYIIAYYNKIKRFYGLKKKIYHAPHNCCSIFMRDQINVNPIKKIYMYGMIDNHYPLRKEFVDKIRKKYFNRLVLKPHPGCIFKDGKQAYDESVKTANELNQYFCSFTSGLFPKFEIEEKETDNFYLIGKFFEIMGNGPLLLCNDYKVKDQLENLGYYRNQHYIHIDKNNFDSTISYIFNDKNIEEINQIRRRAQEHTRNNHYSAILNRKLNGFLLKLDAGESVDHLVVDSL